MATENAIDAQAAFRRMEESERNLESIQQRLQVDVLESTRTLQKLMDNLGRLEQAIMKGPPTKGHGNFSPEMRKIGGLGVIEEMNVTEALADMEQKAAKARELAVQTSSSTPIQVNGTPSCPNRAKSNLRCYTDIQGEEASSASSSSSSSATSSTSRDQRAAHSETRELGNQTQGDVLNSASLPMVRKETTPAAASSKDIASPTRKTAESNNIASLSSSSSMLPSIGSIPENGACSVGVNNNNSSLGIGVGCSSAVGAAATAALNHSPSRNSVLSNSSSMGALLGGSEDSLSPMRSKGHSVERAGTVSTGLPGIKRPMDTGRSAPGRLEQAHAEESLRAALGLKNLKLSPKGMDDFKGAFFRDKKPGRKSIGDIST